MKKYLIFIGIFLLPTLSLAQISKESLAYRQAGESGKPIQTFQKGYALLSEGQTREAIAAFITTLSVPKFILSDYTHLLLAKAYFNSGDYRSAAAWSYKIVKKYPKSILLPEAYLITAKSYLALNKTDAAIKTFSFIARKFPHSSLVPEARFLSAQTLENKGDLKNAYIAYQNVELYHPFSPFAKIANKKIKALQKSTKSLPVFRPSAQALFDKAMLFWEDKDYDHAATYFSKLAKEYPKSSLLNEALLMLGRAELQRNKVKLALSDLTRAAQKGGLADRANFYLAIAYGRNGELGKAISILQSILKNHPASEMADDAAYFIGNYYELSKNIEQALLAYWQLLKDYSGSERANAAVWQIGKIYYWAGDYQNAYRYLALANQYPRGEYSARALFFQGRAAEKMGKPQQAIKIFTDLAEKYDFNYYGYRAREKMKNYGIIPKESRPFSGVEFKETIEELKGKKQNLEELAAVVEIWEAANQETLESSKEARNHLEKCKLLVVSGIASYAAEEAVAAMRYSDQNVEEPIQNELAMMLQRAGEYRAGIKLVDRKMRKAIVGGDVSALSPKTWQLAYPKGYFIEIQNDALNYNLDPYLVLAVIREESRFNPKALSRSKAHGLMQIIPKTGKGIASRLKIKPFDEQKMFDPSTNIQMGTYYLSSLLKKFDGNFYLALASYNGGPNRIDRYLKTWYKDIKAFDVDDFVESIPITETRYYVQKVMESYFQYKRIYGNS